MAVLAVDMVSRGISLTAGAGKLLDNNDNLQSACHICIARVSHSIYTLHACVCFESTATSKTSFQYEHRTFCVTSNSVHFMVAVGCTALLLRHPRT
jgi:hypothetical protein